MSLGSRYLLFIISLLCGALFVRLGIWQLSRLHERRGENRLAAEARAARVVDLNTPAPAELSRTNRRVMVRGEYDRSREIVLRGHMYREVPGVEIVTPLRIEGSDSAVLVNRGFLPSPDATFAATDSLIEPGVLRVEGVAFAVPTSSDSGTPVTSNGKETWRRLDLPVLRGRFPYPLLDVYILQTPDSGLPLYPRRLEPQPLNDGPHLSYAIQWFAFATIAVAGGAIFVLRKGR
jgi:surfeit locus 1 family protein